MQPSARPRRRCCSSCSTSPHLRQGSPACRGRRTASRTRRALWRDFVASYGLEAWIVDLVAPVASASAGSRRHDSHLVEPDFAHQRRQDDAGAHAAASRRRRDPRREPRDAAVVSPHAARDRDRRRARALGHARIWRQRAVAAPARAELESARLVPVASLDRYADRPFFSSQQALRIVRDHADVVLYLVNVSEDPAASAYIEPEMRILDWIAKPVIVVMNQLGLPDPVREGRDLEQWRARLREQPNVRDVLAFRRIRALLGARARAARPHGRSASAGEASGLRSPEHGMANAQRSDL